MSDPALSYEAATAPWAEALLGWTQQVPEALAPWVERLERVWLPASEVPWTSTGIDLRAGQAFSLFATGRVLWSERGDQWAGPRHHLWGRIAAVGPVFNPTQDSTTRVAERDGGLELCLLHGFWKHDGGELATSTRAYRGLRGGVDVLVVPWRGDPGPGLAALESLAPDTDIFHRERARFTRPVTVPEGWHYHLETGSADVFRARANDPGPAIEIDSHNDQGIIRKPIDLPLRDDTVVSWTWRLDEFPSERAENEIATHDYMSVAVEFDNGRDLTWFWSRCLPVGTHFGCPVRSWNYREIHYCVRSGGEGRGRWHRDKRHIAADCREALGEVPARIVAVWLIVVSSFQHGRARGAFADIRLESAGETIQVL